MKACKIVLFYLIVVCTCLWGSISYAQKDTNKNLAQGVWSRLLESNKWTVAKRKIFAEQIHEAINKSQFSKEDEGIISLALAVLHSYDSNTRYASLALVGEAKNRRPNIINDKNIATIWNVFTKNLYWSSHRNLITLAGIAGYLDGPELQRALPPRFAYFRGLNLFARGEYNEALKVFVKVPLDSYDYRQAKYLEAVSLISLNHLNEAISALQMVVSLDITDAEVAADIKPGATDLRELGVITIARLLYEQGKFKESLAYYRTLMQDSQYFYESLSEQSWSFFMAGYPNRAMGAAYAATSPFFKDRINSDVRFLDSVVSYWLCDFSGSKYKLQEYITHTRAEGDLLRSLVSRVNVSSKTTMLNKYAHIIEDAVMGASAKNIGLGQMTIATILKNEKIIEANNALRLSLAERTKLQSTDKYTFGKTRILWALGEFESTLRASLGFIAKQQLNKISLDFEKTLMQSRLLYLEILTAEKDVIMGQGRSVGNSQFQGIEKDFADLGATVTHNWNQDKSEYWYDELGHYVFKQQSQCKK